MAGRARWTLNELAEDLEKLIERVEVQEALQINDEQRETLRRGTIMLRRLDALGWFGRNLLWVLGGAALAIGNYDRVAAWFRSWSTW